MKKTSRTLLLLYILLGYVVAQFIWWGYSIYDLNKELATAQFDLQQVQGGSPEPLSDVLSSKLYMVIGEGSVFLVLLILGVYFLSKFIAKSEQMSRRERNFLMATTHEFNSPIAAMKLNLQTLQKRSLDTEQQQKVVGAALDANHRLENLVSNILVASRLDTGKLELYRERVNMHTLINGITRQFMPLAHQAKCELLTECSEELEVEIDASATQSILGNLIENALKYAPSSKVLVSATKKDDVLMLDVSDSGPGIDANEKQNVLEKFYRVQNEETRAQKGTGLGLYIVAQLTARHDGKLSIQDNSPKGTIFRVQLKIG